MILPLAHCYTRATSFVRVHALTRSFRWKYNGTMRLSRECVLINDDGRSFRAVARRCPLRRARILLITVSCSSSVCKNIIIGVGKRDPEKRLCRMILHGRNISISACDEFNALNHTDQTTANESVRTRVPIYYIYRYLRTKTTLFGQFKGLRDVVVRVRRV